MRHRFLGFFVAGLALAAGLTTAAPSGAAVNVSIGINLPGPPQLAPIPETPIQYAPSVDANYFFYGGQYYVFTNGAWYVSRGYNGPWAVVAPEFVPRPLLGVPVRYYHRRPSAWSHSRAAAPPRWEPKWGRRWEERRFEGQALPREDRRGDEHRRDRHDDRDGHHDDRR
jgi:hypothetical protein